MKVGDLIKWLSWDQKQQVGILVRKQEDAVPDGLGIYWQVLGAAGLLFCRQADMEVINASR
jgi:hypothetical protein